MFKILYKLKIIIIIPYQNNISKIIMNYEINYYYNINNIYNKVNN